MAARKTVNFLPTVFQTDVNQKFLSATLDHLVEEPNLKNIYGYVGRTFASTYKAGDSYVIEPSKDRQQYQLEPSIVVKDKQQKVTFFASYVDLLNKIKYYGGLTENHDRLFNNAYYTYDPLISFDKFVNYAQYYWLPNGPDAVDVNTSGIAIENKFTVTRNIPGSRYDFNVDNKVNNTITLARGGVYTFTFNQPGYNAYIQTEPGIAGVLSVTPTLSSREVLGVTNNGIDQGSITFSVPQSTAQDRFLSMKILSNVDYATPIPWNEFNNQLLSQFLTNYPQYQGIVGQLDGKYLIFVDQDTEHNPNYGENSWVNPQAVDPLNNPLSGFDTGYLVPEAQRFGIWQVRFVQIPDPATPGSYYSDPLIRLVYIQDIAFNEKVYIKYGVANANKEFYKEYDGFLHKVPLISSILDTVYLQDVPADGSDAGIYTTIKIVDPTGWTIDAENDILDKNYYTSPNGVEFTSGLKIKFGADVTPASYQNNEYYVEQVGAGIKLVEVTALIRPELYNDENAVNYPGQEFPEYITINRASADLNPWTRNNRWFHKDAIAKTAEYNGVLVAYDQNLRAQRPIVQFETNIQLFNNGRIGKHPVEILDTTTDDAFNAFEGQVLTEAFGIILFDGMRVIFSNDADPLVRNKIYIINLVQYSLDGNGLPTGPKYVNLTKADDGDIENHDTVVVLLGQYKGSQWWYDATVEDSNGQMGRWTKSQQKTQVQQDPLFDVLDPTGKSFSTYTRSTFKGTRLFGYVRKHTTGLADQFFDGVDVTYINQSGTADAVLGFPLQYRSFTTQGDIEFANYFNTDTFEYYQDQLPIIQNINTGFVQKIQDRNTLLPRNTWQTVVEPSKQYQLITYVYNGSNSPFYIDVPPAPTQATIPYLKVYKNNSWLKSTLWAYDAETQTVTLGSGVTLTVGDKIDLLVYSFETSKLGHYEVPLNLDLNAQNADLSTLTLGQLRNHLVTLSQNSTELVGDILGSSNLRDIEIKAQGGNILQQSAPLSYASLFLLDDKANFIDAIRFAALEYSKFKNKFMELSGSLPGIQPTDPAASVDAIITQINKIKNKSFPWHYSDMVPYGTLVHKEIYTVFDPFKRNYEIAHIFSDITLSNEAFIVYINGRQLIKTTEYEFSTTLPAVTILDSVTLVEGDIIKIVQYLDTNGNYIPETPTKLGMYPKFIPRKFLDDSYRVPIYVIKGHDGSITPAFNDYRDDILLEMELRIFNNIKLSESTGTYGDLFALVPGKFRKGPYNLSELNQILGRSLLAWAGNNKLDYTINNVFDSNDPFTWNYGQFFDKDGERLPGSWRACYQYYYDTYRPHIAPWEMLGFTEQPTWWEKYYGIAPYTGGNKLLWDDLEAGRIREGLRSNGQDYTIWEPTLPYTKGQYIEYENLFYVARISNGPSATFVLTDWYQIGQDVIPWVSAIDDHFARPGLSIIIPVDDHGNLYNPAQILAGSFTSSRASSSWAVGQQGPVEFAWRNSSDFGFATQIALALANPAGYFGYNIDVFRYYLNYTINQYITDQNSLQPGQHIKQNSITYNGDATNFAINQDVNRSAGYLNWISDYLTNQGIDPGSKITSMLKNYQVNLAYKMAGFTDQKYLQVLAEQNSPSSTNDSVMIPNENYNVLLYKSTPVQKLVYSSVIIEKSNNGWSVRGYNLGNPFFTIIPSVVNSNAYKIKVLNSEAVIFNDYQNLKLTVPYGYEFTTPQQIADFLIGYERWLVAQGFTFIDSDDTLGEIKNWKLSVKEFLYWYQQGWKEGSILVLSPVSNSISAISVNSITDGIEDSQYGSKVLDQNFNLVKNTDYTVMRSPSSFKVTLNNDAVVGYVEVNLVQYEHVLIFDNTTVFSDIIYKPELGNRQFRLKLIGQKTANWDGSLTAPGFIYSSGEVDGWIQGRDYLKGDLITYKDQYYVALQNITGSSEFDTTNWKQIDSTQIQKGLLPNFSTLAVKSQSYYNSHVYFEDNNQIAYSHGLIGFKPRQYLSDLGISNTTQIELYKGYVRQKGTENAVNQMTKAEFNNLSGNISLFEEWAIRVGEYGALDGNPYVEVALEEKAFSVNPATVQFVGTEDNNVGNGLTIFNKSQLIKVTDQYSGNIALARDNHSDYDNDIPTAGYVNIDDVNATIFDLANYVDLDGLISKMGSGYTIWCAKDFTQNWNVYRVTETNNKVTTVANALNGLITLATTNIHNLAVNSVILVKGFSTAFDGFYQVYKVIDLNTVMVKYSGSTQGLTTESGIGELYRLDSLRFVYMEDCRVYGQPPNGWLANSYPNIGWKTGEKIWIDDDAATTAVQGQPYTVESGGWKVYEKMNPWSLGQSINKAAGEYTSTDGFGTSIKLSADGLTTIVGSPTAYTDATAGGLLIGNIGAITVFSKNSQGTFVEGTGIRPDSVNTAAFGSTIELANDGKNYLLAVGSPYSGNATLSNIGYVHVYTKPLSSSAFERYQILTGNISNVGDQFGSSLAMSQDGRWLYVGAPGNNNVYVYGLNTFVPYVQQTISVNDQTYLQVPGLLTASTGNFITQPATGSNVQVLAPVLNASVVAISNASNIVISGKLANITLSSNVKANLGDYITQTTSGANILVGYTTPSYSNTKVVIGTYQSSSTFDTLGNIYINGNIQIASSTFVITTGGGGVGGNLTQAAASGIPGSGGGGAFYSTYLAGAAGSTSIYWTQSSDGALAGSGGGGGGGGNSGLAGSGATYGAGAGGGNSGVGAQGIIVFKYISTGGTVNTVFIKSPGRGTYTVPSDYVSFVSIEAIGSGGAGSKNINGSSGGGGGAYAKSTSVTGLTAGGTAYYQIGTTATDSWFNISANAVPSSSTLGVLAKAGTSASQVTRTTKDDAVQLEDLFVNQPNNIYNNNKWYQLAPTYSKVGIAGLGGSAAASIGELTYSGGNGGVGYAIYGTSGGGGGSAGPGGSGGSGGDGYSAAQGGSGGGGGGASYSSGSAGGAGILTAGGSGGANNYWANVAVTPSTIGSGNLFLNGVDLAQYPSLVYTKSITNSLNLGFSPYIANDARALLVTSRNRTYIPNLDYTVAGSTVTFKANIDQNDVTVTQQSYYSLITTLTGNANSKFGYAISSSYDGAQLAVGAPNDTALGLIGAGTVSVYDRNIEAFVSNGGSVFGSKNTISSVHRVTVDNIETTDYAVTDSNTINFTKPPSSGKIIYLETNQFTLLEKLIGVTSLTGDTSTVQANSAFGSSLTICSNNCAIYVGAPYYDNGPTLNTGAVWKFHNRGRLYGTNNGYTLNPIFIPGDSIRLDNFEITVIGRTPAVTYANVSANVLTLSGNITAAVGSFITQTTSGANATVLSAAVATGNTSTSVIVSLNNTTPFYYGPANVIAVNGVTTTSYPGASLDSLVLDINNAGILGISAKNENGYLRLNSNKTIAKNLLRILTGTTPTGSSGVYAAAGLKIFAYMQIIVNPYNSTGEYFGSQLKLASNAYMLVISSDRGTTKSKVIFDSGVTTIDYNSTNFKDNILGSGSVYVYELYDDPRNEVEHPGRYAFAQQLNTGDLNPSDYFGRAIDIYNTDQIVVTAPGDDTNSTNAGSVYLFVNPAKTRSWKLIRYQQPKVDIDSISRMYLYSKLSNSILTNLEFIDPAKGKILGQAEQEITYKTGYDPAVYNRGTNADANINSDIYWNDRQVDHVWWNLSQVRFIDYEQSNLVYRSINWGRLFPNSIVEVCEWVESTVVPSKYVAAGYDGVPKYADDSAYVEIINVDPTTNIIGSKYYFWVTNKTSLSVNNPKRTLPIATVQDYIANPKNQNIAYAAITQSNTVILYNISEYLSATNTVLHIDYETTKNTSIIHSEYELIQRGNSINSYVPNKIITKMVDSLAGLDMLGAVVPDPRLALADRYGISVRPRQSMFVDRLRALGDMIAYVNTLLIQTPVARQHDLALMKSQEPLPSFKEGAYNQTVATDIELTYIDNSQFPVGYKILVKNDTQNDGLWVIYQLTADYTWEIARVQSYKTEVYWEYVNWFSPGYTLTDQINYVVDTYVDALKIPTKVGDEVLVGHIVRVNKSIEGGWNLYVVNSQGILELVGIEDGTIQLKSTINDFANNDLGFGNQGYASKRYDQSPNIEIRYIINALKDSIFTNELDGKFNDLFFIMINYLFTEQQYVDWMFKTSFVTVSQKLRALAQYPNYIKDNQTYLQDYINEVKPYRTNVREYLINYDGKDNFAGSVTDFDLPPYFDTVYQVFRSPNGEDPYITSDEARWANVAGPYNQWYQYRTCSVNSIMIEDAGLGYATPPIITIVGGGADLANAATATARLDGNGSIISINLDINGHGSGYTTTPTVLINGSNSKPAKAYAVLKNTQLRSFNTTLKFDRISYTSSVKEWASNTAYTAGEIITYAGLDGNTMIRQAYQVKSNLITGSSFIATDYNVYQANTFTTASDRIAGYYEPGINMPAVENIVVPMTLANAAVNTNVIYVFAADNLRNGMYVSEGNIASSIITNIKPNIAITISNIATRSTQVTLSSNVSLAVGTNVNASYKNLGPVINGIDYPGVQVIGSTFAQSPEFDGTFDIGAFENVQYDEDGNPILSDTNIDTIIRSTYADASLGLRPEDINVDGSAYVDRYSSHAPEELVPGVVFDTLDMRIYTQINGNTQVLGYRIFNNMLRQTSYLRIADAHSTTLSQALRLTDTVIHVTDASVLPEPNTVDVIPGVIFIGSERITYYTIDYATNTLGQIRRGTEGTAMLFHAVNSRVIDGSYDQLVPTATSANIWYNSGSTTASDGTGFEGSSTAEVLFLKSATANNILLTTIPDLLITEDAINTIITEGSKPISEEDQE